MKNLNYNGFPFRYDSYSIDEMLKGIFEVKFYNGQIQVDVLLLDKKYIKKL
jgi:hypothetical protein